MGSHDLEADRPATSSTAEGLPGVLNVGAEGTDSAVCVDLDLIQPVAGRALIATPRANLRSHLNLVAVPSRHADAAVRAAVRYSRARGVPGGIASHKLSTHYRCEGLQVSGDQAARAQGARSKSKRVPRCSSLTTRISLPCSSSIRFAIARPSPVERLGASATLSRL